MNRPGQTFADKLLLQPDRSALSHDKHLGEQVIVAVAAAPTISQLDLLA
jgi:hypothetical protein